MLHYDNGEPKYTNWIKPRLSRKNKLLAELRETSKELTHAWHQYPQTMGEKRDNGWFYDDSDKEKAEKDLPAIDATCRPGDKVLQIGQIMEENFWQEGGMVDQVLQRLNNLGRFYIVDVDEPSYKKLRKSRQFKALKGKEYALPLTLLPQSMDVVILPLKSGLNVTPDREMRLQEILFEINRVLKPGGSLIVKGHSDAFVELQYYGKGILDGGRYTVSPIEGVVNPYEWRRFTKVNKAMALAWPDSKPIKAMVKTTLQGPGGIDLTFDQSLRVKSDGASKANNQIDSAMMLRLQNIHGFVPVVINFQLIDLKESLEQKV